MIFPPGIKLGIFCFLGECGNHLFLFILSKSVIKFMSPKISQEAGCLYFWLFVVVLVAAEAEQYISLFFGTRQLIKLCLKLKEMSLFKSVSCIIMTIHYDAKNIHSAMATGV